MKILAQVLAAGVVCLFVGGVGAEEEKEKKPVNEVCPLTGQAVDDTKVSAVTAEFCCDNCKGKFEKDPAKYLEQLAKAEEGKCILTGNPVAKKSELVVGFCCGNCKAKFDKAPKDYIAKVKIPKKED